MTKQIVDWPVWAGVIVENLELQRRFYRDVLGLKESREGDGWVQFDLGWPNVFEVLSKSSLPQFEDRSFQVAFSVGDIKAVRDELIARGAEPLTHIEGGPESGGYWCYFRDAEGNAFAILQRIDLQRPTD